MDTNHKDRTQGHITLFTIPNLITLMNLACGCAAVVSVLVYGDLTTAFYFVVAGAVLDFCDGMAARLLHSYSEVGKQLDSLSDLVTFGLAPSTVLFHIMTAGGASLWIAAGAYLLTLFSALRLAKFNVDTTQTENFVGFPTPACGLLVSSAGWIHATTGIDFSPVVILGITFLLSYLLISPVPMFSFKFRSYGFGENRLRYLFLAFGFFGLILFRIYAIPFIIMAYIVVSLSIPVFCRRETGPAE